MKNVRIILALLLAVAVSALVLTAHGTSNAEPDYDQANGYIDIEPIIGDYDYDDIGIEPISAELPELFSNDGAPFQIGIIQIREHPALDQANRGFLSQLSEEIYFDYDLQVAQGDNSVLATIAQQFVNNNKDLILANATPSVQAIANETDTIPIVGVSITSYVRAGVVESNEAPGRNVTGASDMNPIQAQLRMMLEFLPDIETIGIIFSSNEENAVYQAEIASDYIENELGLAVDEATVTTTGDIDQVARALAGRVDVIYIPTDNTMAEAMPLVANISIASGTPVFPGETQMALAGGVATLSVDYYELGRQAGRMAIEILRDGGNPATMPIQFAEGYEYIVNGFMAEQLGVEVPARFLNYVVNPHEDATDDEEGTTAPALTEDGDEGGFQLWHGLVIAGVALIIIIIIAVVAKKRKSA